MTRKVIIRFKVGRSPQRKRSAEKEEWTEAGDLYIAEDEVLTAPDRRTAVLPEEIRTLDGARKATHGILNILTATTRKRLAEME